MADLTKVIKILMKLDDQASAGLGKTASKLDAIGTSMRRTGGQMTAGLTVPLVAAGAAAVKMASDVEEMQGKFDVVFGQEAQRVTDDLTEMGKAMNRSRFELMEFASSFQDTFVPMGFARDAAADLSTELTALTVDLASFNNVAEGDVARDLQSALVGNVETMRKYGVVINQAVLDTELLRMGIEGGIKTATEAEKVQARLNLIIAGTADAQGDAVRTSESFANQMRGLQAAMKDLGVVIGQEILPMITPVVQGLTKLVTSLSELPDPVIKAIVAIGGIVAALGPIIAIVGQFAIWIGAISGAFSSLSAAAAGAGGAFAGLSTAAAGAGAAIAAVAAPIALIIVLIVALIAVIVLVVNNWDELTAIFKQSTVQWKENIRLLGEIALVIGDKLSSAFQQAGKAIKDNFLAVLRTLPLIMKGLAHKIMQGLIDGVKAKLRQFIDVIKNMAINAQKVVTKAFKIRSPSAVMFDIGQNITQGLINGVESLGGLTAGLNVQAGTPSLAVAGAGAGKGGGVYIQNLNVPPGTTREQIDIILREIDLAQRKRGGTGR